MYYEWYCQEDNMNQHVFEQHKTGYESYPQLSGDEKYTYFKKLV